MFDGTIYIYIYVILDGTPFNRPCVSYLYIFLKMFTGTNRQVIYIYITLYQKTPDIYI